MRIDYIDRREGKVGKGGGFVLIIPADVFVFTPFLAVFICSPAYFLSCVDYIFVSEDQSGIDRTL